MNGAAQAAAQQQAARDAARALAQSQAMNGAMEASAARDAAAAVAQTAAMRALPSAGDQLVSPSVLAHAAKALAITGASAALEQVKSALPSFSARALPISPEARAANAERRLTAATASFQQAVAEKPALDATAALNSSLKSLRPEQRGPFLQSAAPDVAKLTEKVAKLGERDTAKAVKDFAKAAELAGPLQVSAVTAPLAKAIAEGKLEQTGKAANGGLGGVLKNANRHNSEREFVQGLAKLEGGQLFKDALAADLAALAQSSSGSRADRAAGFAAAVVSGDASQVPDKGVWNSVRTLPTDVSAKLDSADARLGDLRTRASNALVDKTLNVSGGLKALKPGDTLTIASDVEVSAGVTVESKGGLEARRNQDGSYTVKASAEVVGGLGALDNKLAVGALGAAEFRFATLDEAKDGALALSRLGMAVGGAMGGGLIVAPTKRELEVLKDNLASVQLAASGAGSLDARFGLSGLQSSGAEGELRAHTGARLELENGKPSAVVSTVELTGEAIAESSQLLTRLGGNLPDGLARADGRVSIEVRTPVDGAKPVTASISVQGSAEAKNRGVEGELVLEGLQPFQVAEFVSRLKSGQLEAALASTGLEQTVRWNSYQDRGNGWLDHQLDAGVFVVGGENQVRRAGERHVTRLVPSADGTRLVAVG